ncbi:Equilibrative nucleoside transporter [Carpediemonas membranifera]|uniref:Equilibrative nucleoside transporter n=1 Tax=Carpediemonas membranifera TaxID=201153 RepID=A0A8J6E222_9EUKA|nr:Equilibrative nucleoside transporter [Carpediemonas membranifera]|eukprot:KAG9393776.1 Equilibrative nucleoside transporter [Carpediemonas membranifera]
MSLIDGDLPPTPNYGAIAPRNAARRSIFAEAEEAQSSIPRIPMYKRLYEYTVFLALGLAMLLPFNVVISVPDYWTQEYPGRHFEFYASSFFCLTLPPVYLIMIACFKLLPAIVWFLSSLGATFVIFIALPIMPLILPIDIAQYSSLTLILLSGAAYSVLGSTVMGMASKRSPTAVQAAMAGQGTAGVVTIFLRIATKAFSELGLLPSGGANTISAFLFFGVCALILAATVPLYLALMVTDRRAQAQEDSAEPKETLTPSMWFQRLRFILRHQWRGLAAVFFVYIASGSVFPGLVTTSVSIVPLLNRTEWSSVLQMAIFLCGDQTGRFIPRIKFLRIPSSLTLALATLRLLAIPTYALLFVFRDYVRFDPFFVILNIVHSTTNGWLSTRSFMFISEELPPELTDMGGVIISTVQSTGLMMSEFIGLALGYLPTYRR